MRLAPCVLVLLALGLAPAAAADRAERSYRYRVVDPYFGPRLPLPRVTEQVVVERGPRLLIEDKGPGILEPNFGTRRLPSTVRVIPVQAHRPWYAPRAYLVREERDWRRPARRTRR
jgi:hypothetical protein